jgi:hypothetical protein
MAAPELSSTVAEICAVSDCPLSGKIAAAATLKRIAIIHKVRFISILLE